MDKIKQITIKMAAVDGQSCYLSSFIYDVVGRCGKRLNATRLFPSLSAIWLPSGWAIGTVVLA